MIRTFCLFAFAAASVTAFAGQGTRLLREPAISRDQVAFVYAGDLWTAPRQGGAPTRITRTPEPESQPRFSPDGRHIAFTRDGDVHVMPAAGGEPRRLTWHPLADRAVAWTPDGTRILIHSDRLKFELTRTPHLFLIPWQGGYAESLPMPRATHGSFSPGGQSIAYGPNPELVLWLPWKRYRGGSLGYIAVYNLATHAYEELPRTQANDVSPMWHGDSIYFLSDRDGTMNLYRYGLKSKRTDRLTDYAEWDVKNPSLGPDAIIYENGGWLFTLKLSDGSTRPVTISVPEETLPAAEQRAVWRQAVDDAWRAYRDYAFSVTPGWADVKPRYEELMNWAADVIDAESVLRDMMGEASQGHVILHRAAPPRPAAAGVLGADFKPEAGYYRITRIYGRIDPDRRDSDSKVAGPLAAAGPDVREGDFLIAVNGKPVRTDAEPYAAFAGTAGREVKLQVNAAPSAGGARTITVTPAADEARLRYYDWLRTNRARVTEASGGRIGYIHVGNVGPNAVELFRSEWRSLRTRVAGMIVDIRNNSGGSGADDIVDWIARRPNRLMYDRKQRVPIWDYHLDGPKVLIANDQAVSGGDELPLLFKQRNAGPVVGTRTFGAMIGSGQPHKVAGGWTLLVPQHGFYWLEQQAWAPENYGVAPDYVVELKPDGVTGGRDLQLEKAIELVAGALKTYRKLPDPPPYKPQ